MEWPRVRSWFDRLTMNGLGGLAALDWADGKRNRVSTAFADSQRHSRESGNLMASNMGSSRGYMTPIFL